jgi:UPF0755 protein
MSGPTDPFDGDADAGGPDEDLPWPQPGPDDRAVADGVQADGQPEAVATPDEDATESRASRRAARSTRVRRRRRILLGVGGSLLVVILAFVLWYELEAHALGSPGPQVVVTVHQGESTSSIVDALSQQHVIGSALAFQVSEVFHGTPSVLPGSYAMHQNLAFSEVRTLLAAGPNIYPVDVRPGFTFSEVAQQVDSVPGHAQGGFAKAEESGAVHSTITATDPNNLEGMLGTGTYLVLPGESDTAILTDMVQHFDHDIAAAGLTSASASALGMTPYQVLIAASIVEKEGYIPVNMPDTARVIYNRLAQGTPLQMDSTVLYALGQDGGPVTAQDLKTQSPYNTYLNSGLTPTPICMPSMDALQAAVHPPAGAWLYFVLVNKNGTMAFSDTYAEQLANEQLAKSRGLP